MADDAPLFLSFDELTDLSRRILSRHGLSPEHVEAVTRTIVAGERDGCASHGAYRLIVCAATLATGKVTPDAEPKFVGRSKPILSASSRARPGIQGHERHRL